MITVKVTFSDGNFLVTGINTDLAGAKRYYLGKDLNIGRGDKDYFARAVKVEELA